MDNKQLGNITWDALFLDVYRKYFNGEVVRKTAFKLAFDAQEKRQEDCIDNAQNLTDEQKQRLKAKLSRAVDAFKDYVEEELRCQNRLIE